ncbi:hypothetical protein [Pseudoalteromonas sp. PS5]|uniref:hypothetical protein n=1 Tax=Pseudoalteromonas sp. PS5 TaxID=1437473 RepID=UPI000FFED109|nr:hypothetical protein [Pseudoalteromonas sp. PS5]RXF04075.1 hypothetical protein D9603_06780 [Pseudoalteromonas sp. PS5]
MTYNDYDWSIVPLEPVPLTMGHINLLNLARHQADNTLIILRHHNSTASPKHLWTQAQSQEMIERWCASQVYVPALKFVQPDAQSSNSDCIELIKSNTSGKKVLLTSSLSECDKFNEYQQNGIDCRFVTPAKDKAGAIIDSSTVQHAFLGEPSLINLQRELKQCLDLGILHYSTYQWLWRYALNMQQNTNTSIAS